MKNLPERIQKIMNAWRGSRILLSAVELDLFSALKGGATAEEAAKRAGTDVRGTGIVLHALASLGLIRKKGSKFFNTQMTADFLAEGGASDWRLGIGHQIGLWKSWSDLTGVVKRGGPQARPERSEADTQAFIGLMHQHGVSRGKVLAKALDLRDVKRAIDLGGGSGAYSIAMARKNPKLHVTLFDRPEVILIAKSHVAEEGMDKNFTFVAGDLTMDDFGDGFDLALISSICHQFSPAQNEALIGKAFKSLRPGGRLAIQDFILNETRTSPMHAAIFAVNMLVNTEGGNSYTVSEYREWLQQAGFGKVTFRRLSETSDLFVAQK